MKKNNPLEFVIAGGLGNQLFMLCAGLYCAEKFGRRITFDISDLERVAFLHPGLNVYELGLISEHQISKRKSIRRIINAPTLLLRASAKIARKTNRLLSKTSIEHRNWNTKELQTLNNYLPEQSEIKILITSGASCPDAVVEAVIQKIAGFYNVQDQVDFLNVVKK